jgi:glycerate kinase
LKGIEFVAEALGLEEAIKNSDLVLTGEGRYDSQTQHGKTVSEVQKLAKRHNKPVVVICGSKKDIPEGTLVGEACRACVRARLLVVCVCV